MIYSNKAVRGDEAVLDLLELDRDAVRIAREDEDVYQCATRGAIRDADYDGDYEIHVYDEGQAERLRTRLIAGGFAHIVLSPVSEAGIIDVVRPSSKGEGAGTVVDAATARDRHTAKKEAEAERGRGRRSADRATRIADGSYRPRGRPKGSPGAGVGRKSRACSPPSSVGPDDVDAPHPPHSPRPGPPT